MKRPHLHSHEHHGDTLFLNSIGRSFKMRRTQFAVITVLISVVFAFSAEGHQGERHNKTAEVQEAPPALVVEKPDVLAQINEHYVREVRPVFLKSCFDCHSANTRYPWYYDLPIATQIIDRDIREARKHIDMTAGFPFKGHGTPLEDLEAIEKVVNEGSMPPWRYRILHRGSRLTDDEKGQIMQWIQKNRSLLKK